MVALYLEYERLVESDTRILTLIILSPGISGCSNVIRNSSSDLNVGQKGLSEHGYVDPGITTTVLTRLVLCLTPCD